MTDALNCFGQTTEMSQRKKQAAGDANLMQTMGLFFWTEHNTFKVSVVHISRNYRWLNVLHILWRSICSLKLQCVEL